MTETIIFEWDAEKCKRNIADHGIDFVEAATVFDDPKVSIIPDIRKNYGEERYNGF